MADNHSDFVAVVRRRDYAGQYCMACDEGLYDARSEDMIQCLDCGDCLPRWMTKAEYAAFQHELEEDEEDMGIENGGL